MANMVKFDDVRESNFIKDPGTYTVKITKCERKTSSTGNDLDLYTLETIDKREIRLALSLVEKAMFRYKMFIRAVNKIPDTVSVGVVDLDSFSKQAIGKKIIIDVVIEAKEKFIIETGKTEIVDYVKIKNVRPND